MASAWLSRCEKKVLIFFLFLHKSVCHGYTSETPCQGTANKYPQHICFHGGTRGPWARNRSPGLGIVPWWPSWLSDQIAFSNSESDVVWRVSRLPPWILELNDLVILNLYVTPMPPIKLRLNVTYCLGGDVVWRILHWNRRIYAILNYHNTPLPPIMFKLNQTYRSVADVIWRFSRWLPWWPFWIS